jgi:hypothetical protein
MMHAVLLAIIAFGARLVAVRRAGVGFDTYGHLYLAGEVRTQRSGPFGAIMTKVVGAAPYRHPFLWHWLIGMIPVEAVVRHQKWISPILDGLFTLCIYATLRSVGFSEEGSFQAALLYVFTPMWFSRLSIGPRISSLTPRLASELAANLFFMATLLPERWSPGWTLVVGGTLSAFVLLSSKFGVQALLFLAPAAALLAWKAGPVLGLCAGFCIAIAVTRGEFLTTVGSQLAHLRWYYRENRRGTTFVSSRNSWRRLVERKHGDDLKASAKEFIGKLLLLNSYTGTLLKMPVLFAALCLPALAWHRGFAPAPAPMLAPVAAATLVFLLINRPALLFLGEAERYLNHVAFFIVAVASMFAEALGVRWMVACLLAYGLAYWVLESFVLHKVYPPGAAERQHADDEIIGYLKQAPAPEQAVLAYPYHAAGGVYRIMLEAGKRTVFCFMTEKGFMEEFEREYSAGYPYTKLERLDEMSRELGVATVIVDVQKLRERDLEDWRPAPSSWKRIDIGAPCYRVYERLPAPVEA